MAGLRAGRAELSVRAPGSYACADTSEEAVLTDRRTKDPAVVDALGRARYELTMHGELLAYLDYQPVRWSSPRLLLTHTEVNPSSGGLGIGTRLVRAALDDIRNRGGTVQPMCGFVQAVIDKHPQYADLVFVAVRDPELGGQQRY